MSLQRHNAVRFVINQNPLPENPFMRNSTNRTVILLTHADADPAGSTISPPGREQAERCRALLHKPTFPIIIRSPIPCTEDTARVVAGIDKKEHTDRSMSLYLNRDNKDDHLIKTALEKQPPPLTLQMLLEQGVEVEQAVEKKARESKDSILHLLARRPGENTLIVGHDILIQALCWQFLSSPGRNFILNIELGRCEGFQLTLDEDGTVILWDDIRVSQFASR